MSSSSSSSSLLWHDSHQLKWQKHAPPDCRSMSHPASNTALLERFISIARNWAESGELHGNISSSSSKHGDQGGRGMMVNQFLHICLTPSSRVHQIVKVSPITLLFWILNLITSTILRPLPKNWTMLINIARGTTNLYLFLTEINLKWFQLKKIIQVSNSIPWVRCASCNVFLVFSHISTKYTFLHPSDVDHILTPLPLPSSLRVTGYVQ